MAEFAIAQDGCAWNNSLAHATFEDNVATHGQETALKFLRADIRSWISERKNESHQWSLFVRDGHMITETGVSLDEMTSNITNGPHSDLVPKNIKATAHLEAATLEEATRLAVIGANRIVLPEQHLDETGNVVSRYLSVWTKNPSDPTRYDGTRIDLGKNTRIEDVRAGTSFAAFGLKEDIAFHQHHEQKHAFVLEVKEGGGNSFEVVEKAIITTIHRSHQETYSRDLQPKALPISDAQAHSEMQQIRDVFDERKTLNVPSVQKVHDADLFVRVPRAVVRETAETMRSVAVFLRDKEKRKEGIDRIRRVFAKGKKLVDNNNAAALLLSTNKKDEERENRPNVQPERLTMEKIREKPVRIVEAIEARHGEMRKSVAVLLFAVETKVALGAAPLLLAALAKDQPKLIRAVERTVRRHERKVRKVRNVREGRKTTERTNRLKPVKLASVHTEKERKKKKRRKVYMRDAAVGRIYTFKKQGRREKNIGVKKIAVANILTPMERAGVRKRKKHEKKEGHEKKGEQEKQREKRKAERRRIRRLRRVVKKAERVLEARRAPKKEKKLWVALAVASQGMVLRSWTRERPKSTEQATIAGVRFGWALWMLLGETLVRTGVKLIHPSGVGSPWVLLSIIYYLTAIREQAVHNYPIIQLSNTTNNQIVPPQQTIPQHVVIFAYAS